MKNVALVVAIVLGVTAAIGVRLWLKQQKRDVEEKLKPVRIAVAKVSLKKGEKLSEDKVTFEERPVAGLSQDSITASRVRGYYNRQVWRDVDRGTDLLASFFLEPSAPPASRGLVEGERAVTINVDAVSGVAGLLRPADRVDIIATMTMADKIDKARSEKVKTFRVLSDVTVLAVDNRLSEGVPGGAGAQRGAYTTVTLAATPQEAEILIYLRAYAQLTLVLRPRFETGEKVQIQDVDIANVENLSKAANQDRQTRLKTKRVEAVPGGGE